MRHLSLLAILLSSLVAHAQTTTTGSAGTCTGSMTGQVGIGVYRSGNIVSVNNTALGTVFGEAECLCDDPDTATNDLQLEILLTTLLPADANGASLELWVGNGCDNYTTRTSTATSQCEKLATTLQTQQFITGVASTNVVIRAPISASSLSTPVYRSCGGATRARTIYLFVYKDPTMPLATCTINTNVNNTGPAVPVDAKAESGDEALTISWSPPAATALQPAYYQLLCSTASGQIVPNKKSTDQAYSTCLSNGDYRQRTNIPIGGNSTATDTDMGTSSLPDMSLGTTTFHPLAAGDDMEPPADDLLGEPVDMAAATTDDGGTSDLATVDLLPPATGYRGVTTTSLPAPFTNLDPAFLCSPPIPSGTTSYSRRIGGLVNGQAYNFVVLAVDAYGNVAPSAVITETPAPVEDFYRRYASEGGTATGFCATNGSFGASELTMLGLLAFLLGVYHRRRLAAWWESLR